MVVAFATAEQMAARTGGAIPADHPGVGDELEAASDLIRGYCGWHVAPVFSGLRFERSWSSREIVMLPACRVVLIESAVVDGVTVDPASVAFDRLTGWTSLVGSAVVVTFTAGLEDVPAVVRAVTLQVAARSLGSPLGLVREAAGAVSVTYSQAASGVSGGMFLTAEEQAALAPYRVVRLP